MTESNRVTIKKDLTKRELTLERVVGGPRSLVWECWTKPEHIAQWWGPAAWTTTVAAMDVRPGGTWHYCMRAERGGGEVWGIAIYQEVREPELISYVEMASNAAGEKLEATQHFVTVGFFKIGQSATEIIIRTQFSSLADLETMEQMGIAEGYGGTLGKLEALLEGLLGEAHARNRDLR
jgi:uncharacterized protein YndB with AHSA1/START domain